MMNDVYPSPSELKGAIRGTLLYLSLYILSHSHLFYKNRKLSKVTIALIHMTYFYVNMYSYVIVFTKHSFIAQKVNR